MLTEELSPKMTLEVASQLFELYLTLADIQRFWSSIPGRWAYSPTCPLPTCPFPQPVSIPSAPFLQLSLYGHLPRSPHVLQPLKGLLNRSPKAPHRKLSWIPFCLGPLSHAGSGCLSWVCSDGFLPQG